MRDGTRLPWYRRVLVVGPLLIFVVTASVLFGSLTFLDAQLTALRLTANRQRLAISVRQIALLVRPWDLPLLAARPPLTGHADRLALRLEEFRAMGGVLQIELLDPEFRVLVSAPPLPAGLTDYDARSLAGELAAGDGSQAVTRAIAGGRPTLSVACIALRGPEGELQGYLALKGASLSTDFSETIIRHLTLTMIASTALLAVALTVFFWRFSRPLSQLAEVAGRLPDEGGGPPIRVDGVGEVRVLAEALEGTRRRVQALDADLRSEAREERERASRVEALSDLYMAHIPVGMAVVSEGSVAHLNAKGAEIAGVADAEGFAATAIFKVLAAALLQGKELRGEDIVLSGPGEDRRIISYSFSPLAVPGSDGHGRVGVAIFSDVTAAREAEVMHRLTANLAAMGQFAAGMAHEIRNPLGAIRDLVELLEAGGEPEKERREIIAQVKTEVDGINTLIERLLAASRPSTGEWRNVSLGAIASEVEQDYRIRRTEPPLVRGAGTRCPVSGDQELLKRVLVNLVDNAKFASPGRVTVEVEEDAAAGECRWRVVDEGPGIPPEMLDRAFLPFTTGRAGGTGLGLYLVHSIVTAHGGRVSLRNLHPGLEALVTLPRKEE